METEKMTDLPPIAPVEVEGLLQRIDAAIERVTTGRAAMRIPADPTDPDLVLADARDWIKQAALAQQPAAVDGAMVERMVEAFLASTGQSHSVTQLQRDLTTKCMIAALAAQQQEPTT